MAIISLYLDKRRETKDGKYPLKIRISHLNTACFISLEIQIEEKFYDKNKETVFGCPNAKPMAVLIANKLLAARRAVIDLSDTDRLSSMTATQIRDYILNRQKSENEKKEVTLEEFWLSFVETRRAKHTKDNYMATLRCIKSYCDVSALTFEDITVKWLKDYERWLTVKQNSKAAYLFNLRAVINAAIDEELTTNYPFRKFSIKTEQTRKRSLTVEQLRNMITMTLKSNVGYFRDMFLLSFTLIGINSVDLAELTKIEEDGRVYYKRAKTHKEYSIKVEPEAMELIEKHRGKTHLVDIAERYKTDAIHFNNKSSLRLKDIYPDLSMYWARHSWATIASELDVPMETISAALGHSMGNKVTAVYINFNRKKVDDANRRVLDYVFKGIKKPAHV